MEPFLEAFLDPFLDDFLEAFLCFLKDFLHFCKDKNVRYIDKLAREQGYFTRKISYNERGLQTEEFIENRINLNTYRYSDDVVEYATTG